MSVSQEDSGFLCETRLRELDSDLHQRYRDSIIVITQLLNRYQSIFPTFTDHSVLHSMSVMELSNLLIGDFVLSLNADELYVLLMSCYLHDVGMGISALDFDEFSDRIDFGNYFIRSDDLDIKDFIRKFHNEFSGEFIKKYAELFDIPSPEHIFAIVQISRGHRKTDLYDETQYPYELLLKNGNVIHLPYLSAIVRLADEIDVTESRNSSLLYGDMVLTDEKDIIEFGKHNAIKGLSVKETVLSLWLIPMTKLYIRRFATRLQRCRKR